MAPLYESSKEGERGFVSDSSSLSEYNLGRKGSHALYLIKYWDHAKECDESGHLHRQKSCLGENHLSSSLVSIFMGQHSTPYCNPWKKDSLDFGIINAFAQTWHDPKGTFLNLKTNQDELRKDIKRRTAACSDSSALYTRGRTSGGGVRRTTTFRMKTKLTLSEYCLFSLFLKSFQIV